MMAKLERVSKEICQKSILKAAFMKVLTDGFAINYSICIGLKAPFLIILRIFYLLQLLF
jgi:hypothetical protein